MFSIYGSSASTKVAEQHHCAKQSASSDIRFESSIKATTNEKNFLLNSKNKSRVIEYLIIEFRNAAIDVIQHHADADHFIVQIALTHASRSARPKVLVFTETDLLVMLVGEAPKMLTSIW